MKMLLIVVSLAIFTVSTATADEQHCLTADYDSDGVTNDLDSDEYDSCQTDPEGLNLGDCNTGAGDGIPDVTECQ